MSKPYRVAGGQAVVALALPDGSFQVMHFAEVTDAQYEYDNPDPWSNPDGGTYTVTISGPARLTVHRDRPAFMDKPTELEHPTREIEPGA